MRRNPAIAFLVAGLTAFLPASVAAEETVAGPVTADLVRIVDGDSFIADARIWPGHKLRISVRIRGIDAPEMRSRCAAERDAARRARDGLAAMTGKTPLALTNIGGGKYYGRVLADVATVDGTKLAARMIESDLARPYGGGKRRGWCG